MEQQGYKSKNYDWKKFRSKSDIAYEAYRKGNKEPLKNHNILKGGDKELNFALHLAKVFFGHIPQGKALDVGCGKGYMTQCLKELGFDASGFDISEEAITLARNSYPKIAFFVGNGTTPKDYFNNQKFNLIYFREFHPFKVVDDIDFQGRVIEDYIDILNEDGFIIISHGKPGLMGYSGTLQRYRSIDYKKVKHYFADSVEIRMAGPFYFFLFNHLGISPSQTWLVKVISFLTRILSFVTRQNWAEVFIIYKSVKKL